MSNVVQLMPRRIAENKGVEALSVMFATQRRAKGDVFWLKENAEWLGVLASMNSEVCADALAPYEEFYHSLPSQLEFFPQYYRFFLSLCLDLEDLGLQGNNGESLCNWVADKGLPDAELSDLQRAEAFRLLARRGAGTADPGLSDRLHRFMTRSETFAIPNKKAAYELAHIAFYLSDYGNRDPQLGPDAIASLEYAGLFAFLDQNVDLLSEICAALRFAGASPSPIWEELVVSAYRSCQIASADNSKPASGDTYHGYLVTGWLTHLSGGQAFYDVVPEGQVTILAAPPREGPLRSLSQGLFELGPQRSSIWPQMRGNLLAALAPESRGILEAAVQSTARFEGFFEGFARAPRGSDAGFGLI